MSIYQAITTKYIGPSNTRAGRIKAKAWAGSVTVEWDHALNSDANHAAAAEALANKYKWKGTWYGGGMPDQTGNVFVCVESSDKASFTTKGEG